MNYTYYQPSRSSTQPPTRQPKKLTRRRFVRGVITITLLVGGFLLVTPDITTRAHGTVAMTVPKLFSKSQTVCLDPGHGGDDPGAPSNDGSISERDINLTVAQRVQKTLEAEGYQVFMTRTTNDVTLSNHDRYTYCNTQHATIMVSIHHNDFQDSTVDYSTALFYKDKDQALATSILNSVAGKLNLQNDGIAQFDDGVLSESTMPAALSEGFFITSDSEYDLLTASGSSRLNDEADAIASGIVTYFTEPAAQRSVINPNPQTIERNDSGN